MKYVIDAFASFVHISLNHLFLSQFLNIFIPLTYILLRPTEEMCNSQQPIERPQSQTSKIASSKTELPMRNPNVTQHGRPMPTQKDVKLDFTRTGLELSQEKCRCRLKIAINLLETAVHLAGCRGEQNLCTQQYVI